MTNNFNDMSREAQITRMAIAIEDYWQQNPGLRLGQIVSNISQSAGYSTDAYYLPDDELHDELIDRIDA